MDKYIQIYTNMYKYDLSFETNRETSPNSLEPFCNLTINQTHPCYRMLSISRVPTLVVINNKTGRVVTNLGMEEIEHCCSSSCAEELEKNTLTVVECWRKGTSALPLVSQLLQSCCVS